MRLFALVMGLCGISLVLLQCNSKPEHGSVDTLLVRDTIRLAEPRIVATATKMNVLYIGVDNPMHLDPGGVNPDDIRVAISGGSGDIRKNGPLDYVASVRQPGEARVRVTGGGTTSEFAFRVKRVPDPVAGTGDGDITAGVFRVQAGLIARLADFDFDCKCEIQGFTVTKIAKRADPVTVNNAGARFTDESQRLIQSARPGDIFIFSNVKARCPGDSAGRAINSLVFRIN